MNRRTLLQRGTTVLWWATALGFLGLADLRDDAIDALTVSINEHTISNPLIPRELDWACIIHLTDIHIWKWAKWIYNIPTRLHGLYTDVIKLITIQKIPREKVIVCVTWDLANKANTWNPSTLEDIIDAIDCFDLFPTKHRFFVPWNHDVDTFLSDITTMLWDLWYQDCSWWVNPTALPLNIVGTPDYTTQEKYITPQFLHSINENVSHELFTILLTHNPDGIPFMFDEQTMPLSIENFVCLSGHTHWLQAKSSPFNPLSYIMKRIAQQQLHLKHGITDYTVGLFEDTKKHRTFINTNGIWDHTMALRTAPHEISIIHLQSC